MKHMKKIVTGLTVMLTALTAALALFACGGASGNFEGKFVLDDVKITGLGENNPLSEFFDPVGMKERMKNGYIEFKADRTAVSGVEGLDHKETLNYELKNGIITLKDSDGKEFDSSGYCGGGMQGVVETSPIKYSGNTITLKGKTKTEAQTISGVAIPSYEVTIQFIFKKV